MVLISRQEAQEKQLKSYFTGVPCRNGHIDKRYTNTGICYSCKKQQAKRDYKNHTKRALEIGKRSYIKNRTRCLLGSQKWAEKNRERSNNIKKAYKLRNIEKCREKARQYQKSKRKDPLFRLSANTSKAIWESLKGSKRKRHWETLVNFTLEQLKTHLESKFRNGMTWENYGKIWEVDHIKPKSLCSSFEETWRLDNLQPLECSLNRSKRNRYIG